MGDQAEHHQTLWQKHQKLLITAAVVITILAVLTVFYLVVQHFGWDWTGFNGGYPKISKATEIQLKPQKITRTEEQQPVKTFWDWLQLLFVPVVLAIAGFWLNRLQRRREERIVDRQKENEQEIATDNQRETLLQEYINKMSELLLNVGLRNSNPEDEVRKIARIRTLTVLPRLDGKRKRSILRFLSESGLISKDKPIVYLVGADLSEADLSKAFLKKTDLKRTNLSKADLSEANLSETDLSEADLSKANLKGATGITIKELEDKAKLLKGTIMPDGSTHS